MSRELEQQIEGLNSLETLDDNVCALIADEIKGDLKKERIILDGIGLEKKNYYLSWKSKQNNILLNPRLASAIGVNEAIFISQLNYWLRNCMEKSEKDPNIREKHFHDGRWWIWKTIDDWNKELPFFSERTLKRIIKSLAQKKILLTANYNEMKIDQTKWYSIDYVVMETLVNMP